MQAPAPTEAGALAQTPPSAGARARLTIPKPSPLAVLGWLALAPVLALSAVLGTQRLSQNGYANVFYSAGVKSMLVSFHNFLFDSFDPGGLVTVDKPPLSLWVQVVSAKLFGFSPLSLLLPEAIVAVITVASALRGDAPALRPARRARGRAHTRGFPLVRGGLPRQRRGPRPDPADAARLRRRAARDPPRALARAARMRGAGGARVQHQDPRRLPRSIPGIALAYLLCAPETLPRRVLKLLAAGVLLGAVSFSWTILVEATPASQRPYVGGSTNNTEMNLTFGYNGFGRVEGQIGGPGQIFVRLGAVAPFPHSTRTILSAKRTAAPKHVPNPILPDGHYSNPTPFGGSPGPLRLFEAGLGDQGGWMLPFALLGLLALALSVLIAPQALAAEASTAAGAPPSRYERIRRDPRTAGLFVLGGWFFAEVLILSFSKGIVHPYYVSALGPGTAAMVGAGVAAFAGRSAGGAPIGNRRNWIALLAAARDRRHRRRADRAAGPRTLPPLVLHPALIGAGVGAARVLAAARGAPPRRARDRRSSCSCC